MGEIDWGRVLGGVLIGILGVFLLSFALAATGPNPEQDPAAYDPGVYNCVVRCKCGVLILFRVDIRGNKPKYTVEYLQIDGEGPENHPEFNQFWEKSL